MSFMGGAECSTSGNPLSQLSKHAQDDKSGQRDRLVNRGPSGALNGGFRNPTNTSVLDEAMTAFLHQQPSALPELSFDHGAMGQTRVDASLGVHQRAHSTPPVWADEVSTRTTSPFGPADFAAFQRLGQSVSARASPMPSSVTAAGQSAPQLLMQQHRPMVGLGMMNGMGVGYSTVGRPVFQPLYRPPPSTSLEQATRDVDEAKGKGKEKVVELDDHEWEAQFAQIELQDRQEKQQAQGPDREQGGEQDESLAMEPELDRLDGELLGSETGFGDFESIWNGIQAERAQWSNRMGDPPYSMDMGGQSLGRVMQSPMEEYLFEEENIFCELGGPDANPFGEGVRIMDEGGNLSLAALAFEAAVQKDPDHVEAWVYLGSAQAQNEKEDAAIRALEHALRLDPDNLAALMGLAVSYTNEGYDSTSHLTLERWLSVKYPQVIGPDQLSSAADMGFTDRQQLHDRVTDLFLRAARLAPDGLHMDPDVQVGLGVLFYGAEEYDKAVDCFSAALASSEQGTSNHQSQIHLLWNRLGATLANSGRSEDAISAYEKALSIRPNFVRARYNLGVSCINMNCEREAAGHLLAALAMHKEVEKSGRERAREILGGGGRGLGTVPGNVDGGSAISDERLDRLTTQNRSTTLYDTLRRVFTQMGRRDLADKVVVGVDPASFREDFEF